MTHRSYRWSILALALALLAGSIWVARLSAQTAKPPATSAPKPEEGDDDPEAAATMPAGQPTTGPKVTATAPAIQNRAAIDALIDQAGKEPPAWWNSVKLVIPPTLDLSWPQPAPPGPWNPNKNVGQYFISIINPNPARHQEGCKLMQHIYTVNKDKPAVQQRAMALLGRIYCVYLQDYARGAYWYRKAKPGGISAVDTADLAYCYFRLGSKELALAEITGAAQISTRSVRVLGSMGELSRALDLAQKIAASYPEDANLAAGDACRFNGRYADALIQYQKVLALKPANTRAPGRLKHFQTRAAADLAGLQAWEPVDLKRIKDGIYKGESVGYRGPVKVDVAIKAGKIDQVKITASRDDWPLNALVTIPAQILAKQSVQGVDMVSGASFTSEAIINATGKALTTAPPK